LKLECDNAIFLSLICFDKAYLVARICSTEKRLSLNLAVQGMYGTVLRRYDQIAFTVGYNEWKLERRK
jgi:hypothetical protein